MSRESARHIVSEQTGYGVTNDGMVALFRNGAYDALGYGTFAEFVDAELDTTLRKLSDSEKESLAVSMRNEGCSLRAVALVTHWSHTTVKTRTKNVSPGSTTIGSDGIRYNLSRPSASYPTALIDAALAVRSAAETFSDLVYDERFEDVRDDVTDQLLAHLNVAFRATDQHIEYIGKAPTS